MYFIYEMPGTLLVFAYTSVFSLVTLNLEKFSTLYNTECRYPQT
jgi:hypothetical protein